MSQKKVQRELFDLTLIKKSLCRSWFPFYEDGSVVTWISLYRNFQYKNWFWIKIDFFTIVNLNFQIIFSKNHIFFISWEWFFVFGPSTFVDHQVLAFGPASFFFITLNQLRIPGRCCNSPCSKTTQQRQWYRAEIISDFNQWNRRLCIELWCWWLLCRNRRNWNYWTRCKKDE